MKKAILFSIIIGIYLIVRFSDISKPLDYNGWTTAHSLITQQIWYENGIGKYYLNPVYTFANQTDKNINNLGGIKDGKGNYYYVSYPPLSFLLPFLIFKLLSIYPALLPLNLFNSFLHLISAILIYLLIALILEKNKQKGIAFGTFTGFILYLFSPGNFWFYTNIYFADVLVNILFIAGVYLVLKIIWQDKFLSGRNLILLGILIFFIVYTEWLGLFFALAILLYSLFNVRKERRCFSLFFTVAISALVSVLVTFFQYSSISGFSDLIAVLQSKFFVRGGFDSLLKLKSYLNIIYFYKTYYLVEILVLVVLALILFGNRANKAKKWLRDNNIFLYFAFVPVALHYLFFFNFNSHHSFSTLKTSPILIVAISLLIHKGIQLLIPKLGRLYYILLTLFVIGSAIIYTQHTFSNYGKYNYQLLGKAIRNSSTTQENIFICNYPDGFIEPQVLYYSHRNIRLCRNREDAEEIINKLNIGKSVIFNLNQERQIINIERIND